MIFRTTRTEYEVIEPSRPNTTSHWNVKKTNLKTGESRVDVMDKYEIKKLSNGLVQV